jgi:hypothetical protein
MPDLEHYEEEIIAKMYNAGIIGNGYRPIQIISSKINWRDIAIRNGINRGLPRVMKRLANGGYVSSRGKSGDVYSLTEFGVYYAREISSSSSSEKL